MSAKREPVRAEVKNKSEQISGKSKEIEISDLDTRKRVGERDE